MPLSSIRQVKTACVVRSAADAWQSSERFVGSLKMFQHLPTQSGSEGEVRSPTCTLQTLTWPSSPFLDHTHWIGQWTLRWPRVGHGWWLSEMEGTTTHYRSSRSASQWVNFSGIRVMAMVTYTCMFEFNRAKRENYRQFRWLNEGCGVYQAAKLDHHHVWVDNFFGDDRCRRMSSCLPSWLMSSFDGLSLAVVSWFPKIFSFFTDPLRLVVTWWWKNGRHCTIRLGYTK